jgi:hypothetical protein
MEKMTGQAKKARSIAKKVETQCKESKKVAAVACIIGAGKAFNFS